MARGLSDPRISGAIKAIHDRPFRPWTVATLAATAAMSRSNFAGRFAVTVGEPPRHYQTQLRLVIARDLLQRGNLLVSDVARGIGYESDAALAGRSRRGSGSRPC
jgi:AraC-like DNA-binding protein